MKKFFSILFISTILSVLMSSCYTHQFVIGEGPQTGVMITERNNFFLYGLVPGKVSDPQKMAGEAKNYEITETHTFVDGLIGVLTFGIFTPTTTNIQK